MQIVTSAACTASEVAGDPPATHDTTVSISPAAEGAGLAGVEELAQMIGSADVVALGEGVHLAAEPLELRNRLFKYLVEERGFTTIAIESGIVEGQVVNEFIATGCGDLPTVVHDGIGWTFDRLPQNVELIRWMREYNANASHDRKLRFYGFDIAGSPGNPRAHRGANIAVVSALKYLRLVDPETALGFERRFQRFSGNLRYDFDDKNGGRGYERLNLQNRDTLTALVGDLVSRIATHEGAYTSASSASDFAWAYRSALAARQVDQWFRALAVGETTQSSRMAALARADDVRDNAQADNVEWIAKREGIGRKLLIFAHSVHISNVPVRRRWMTMETADSPEGGVREHEYPVAGTYWRWLFGQRLVTIGSVIGGGRIGCAGVTENLNNATPSMIAGIVGIHGSGNLIVDLRSLAGTALAALSTEQVLADDQVLGYREEFLVPARQAFDVLVYLDIVSPACPQ